MAIPTHRVLVCELGEDKAEAQLLPWQGPVVVAVVVLLITQGEGLRQGLQLGRIPLLLKIMNICRYSTKNHFLLSLRLRQIRAQ